MESKAFVTGLVDEMRRLFARLGAQQTLEADGAMDVVTLLKLALKSELEASELAGFWMPTTPEVEAKLVFAQQCGDEMKHYRLIAHRLAELGETLEAFDPLAEGYSPLYQYLRGLQDHGRAAGGGAVHHARRSPSCATLQFIAFCRSVGDDATARALRATSSTPRKSTITARAAGCSKRMCNTPQLAGARRRRHAQYPRHRRRAALAGREGDRAPQSAAF